MTALDRKARADQLRANMGRVLESGRSLRWDYINTSAERMMQKYLEDCAKWAGLLEEAESDFIIVSATLELAQEVKEEYLKRLIEQTRKREESEDRAWALTEAAEYARVQLHEWKTEYMDKADLFGALERLEAVLKPGGDG